jgi:hypothetical protein
MQTITSDTILRVRDWLKALPQNVKQIASEAFAEYVVGDEGHGLKHYPPYKYLPWSKIGGFVSDRQRRYVMARIHDGTITPGVSQSNGYFRDAWTYSAAGSRYVIKNDVSYAQYLVGPGTQATRPAMTGWRKWTQTIEDNAAGGLRHAVAKINEWMKKGNK